MAREAEMPGRMITMKQWQMICLRYHTVAKFVQEKEVLEVGCGTGLGVGYLSRRARGVVGGDISRENIECARQHYENKAKLLLMDAHKLPFKNEMFDVVATMEVIYYLRFGDFLDECYRVLKKDGFFIFCLPNKDRGDGFQGSLLSSKYYSIPELCTLLNQYQFDARVFGAFRVEEGNRELLRQRLLKRMAREATRAIDLMPKGKDIRGFVNRFILGRIVLKEEILDGDMKILRDVELVPLSRSHRNFDYEILYGIAHIGKSKNR